MADERIVRCSSCQALIIFLQTPAGKQMPVNAETVEPHDTVYEHGRHVNHWGTCTNPNRHRKPRKP
jgi:hypothetical protein